MSIDKGQSLLKSFPPSTGSQGKRHLASFLCGWTSGKQGRESGSPTLRRVGGTRRDPESLGRSAECHFTRGPRVSPCRISDSPVLFEEASFSSQKSYDSTVLLLPPRHFACTLNVADITKLLFMSK